MNSFIPKSRGNLAIVDGRADLKIISNLEKLGLRVIRTVACRELDRSISYHPDVVLHPIDHKTIIVAPNVYDYYREELKEFDLNIISGDSKLSLKYPGDIAYNVGRIGNLAIHNIKYTDEKLKTSLEEKEIELLSVKQGYSKCSLGLAGENLAITSDRPIYKELKARAYDILLVRPGHIRLKGQNYGFIGGCMGCLSEDMVLFSGAIDKHPDFEDIDKFLKNHGKEYICLSDDELVDIGTIMVFKV